MSVESSTGVVRRIRISTVPFRPDGRRHWQQLRSHTGIGQSHPSTTERNTMIKNIPRCFVCHRRRRRRTSCPVVLSWNDQSCQLRPDGRRPKRCGRHHGRRPQRPVLHLHVRPECMYRGTAEQPKLYCELFDVDVRAFALRGGNAGQRRSRERRRRRRRTVLQLRKPPHCSIRMPEGNVWHCEEYR